MSSSYPRVHVVGSGAYYSYRPTNRFVDRGERNYIRDCSSRPKEFSQYGTASTSSGDGYKRAPSTSRGSSLPPLDSRESKRSFDTEDDSFFKRTGDSFSKRNDDSFFKRNDDSFSNKTASYFSKKSDDDSFLNRRVEDTIPKRRVKESVYKRGEEESIVKRRGDASYFQRAEDDTILARDRSALFSSGEDTLTRLRRKHPFRLPVENEVTAPHESSIWPENRPHFDLVSSYDVMVDYLGIRDKTKK